MREFHEYPKWKYKEGESARLVQTHNEEVELGDAWFDKPDNTNHSVDLAAAATSAAPPGYVPTEYPKWRYAPQFPGGRLVHNEEEEDNLPGDVEWFDKPDYTDHGQDSTDLTKHTLTPVMAPAVGGTQPLSDPLAPNVTVAQPGAVNADAGVLQPVPEMKQGTARQEAGDETDESRKGLNEATAKAQAQNQQGAADIAGSPNNNFDHATGTNAGDAVPEGKNPNDAVGRVTASGDQDKTLAQETKGGAPKAGKAKKDADDLL